MWCYECHQLPIGACRLCGLFCCASHGEVTKGGLICVKCHKSFRPWAIVFSLLPIAGAVYCGAMVVQGVRDRMSDEILTGVLGVLLCIGIAIVILHHAFRKYPRN
jgi:hypothetical protein